MTKYLPQPGFELKKEDLQEGKVYEGRLVNRHGQLEIAHCLYTMLHGRLFIHRSANWDDVSPQNLTRQAFVPDNTISNGIACFKATGKTVERPERVRH